MIILGISAYYHDSAACLVKDGEIISAVQEERFTRIKHDPSFPVHSIKFCLNEQKINLSNVNYVVFYDKPFLKFERLLETYLAFAPKGFKSFVLSMTVWIKEKLFQKYIIIKELNKINESKINWKRKLLFTEHHLSHAASCFFPSPFKEAAILTMDGVGEWTTTSVSIGKNNKIEIIKEINFPHSLGLLYSAFTYFCGFKVNSGEYKLMGLAPYGKPKYVNLIKENLINIKSDGSYKINIKYFDYCVGLTMTNKNFEILFNRKRRSPETNLTQDDMDMASSIQKVFEEIIIKIALNISETTKMKNLCLSGGVALNCVVNGVLQKNKFFNNIWIQPAAGDAGGALGAAVATYYMMLNNKREVNEKEDSMKGSYLGPWYQAEQIKSKLENIGGVFHEYDIDQIINITAEEISKQKIIGWMQGKMEFGPRALGGRSIIADPRSSDMQKKLNLKIKFRESFRPFAPSILLEETSDWFDLNCESPYMLLVADIDKEKKIKMSEDDENLFGIEKLNISRSSVPAITHVDYSARIQTVNGKYNSVYYKLLNKFNEITGCPILINTSFNVRGEPIICSPDDAFKCFMGTEMDILVIENFILYKKEQDKNLLLDYKNKYSLD